MIKSNFIYSVIVAIVFFSVTLNYIYSESLYVAFFLSSIAKLLQIFIKDCLKIALPVSSFLLLLIFYYIMNYGIISYGHCFLKVIFKNVQLGKKESKKKRTPRPFYNSFIT